MPLSPVQIKHQQHVLTAQDIVNGYVAVPIVWDIPFSDTDYSTVFGIHDLDPLIDLSFAVGDVHNKTFEGLEAIVYIAAATPLIQGQEDVIAGEVVSPIVLQAPVTTLYQVTFYYGPSDATGAGTWSPSVSWQDPAGNNLILAYPYLGPATAGNVENYQSYSIPFFVKGGTPITVTGTYSGAAFPLNLSIRVVQMPNNAVIAQPGDTFVVDAVALHD